MDDDLKETIRSFKKITVRDPSYGRFCLQMFKEEEDKFPSKMVLIPERQMDDVIAFLEMNFCDPKNRCEI